MDKLEVKASQLANIMESIRLVITTGIEVAIPAFMLHDNTVTAKNNSCLLVINFDHPFNNIMLPFTQFNELIAKIPPFKTIKLYESNAKIEVEFGTGSKTKTAASIPSIVSQPELASQLTSEELLPPLESETKKVPSDFVKGLKMCSDTLPRESLNFAMTLYSIKNDTIISSDEARLSRYKMETGFDTSFLISRENANIITTSKFDEYCSYENSITFISSDKMARFALPTEKYPEINEGIFGGTHPFNITFATKQFISALERTVLFSEGSSDMAKIATIHINPNDYKLESSSEFGKNVEIGKIRATLTEPVEFKFNPVYLLQIIKLIGKIDKTKATICRHSSGYKIVFETDNFSYVLASWNI